MTYTTHLASLVASLVASVAPSLVYRQGLNLATPPQANKRYSRSVSPLGTPARYPRSAPPLQNIDRANDIGVIFVTAIDAQELYLSLPIVF